MFAAPQSYAIWPSVFPADTPAEVIIAPNERAFLPEDGEEYALTVISIDADELNYYEPVTPVSLTVAACEGVLRFSYTFPGEQEHLLILSCGEKKLQEFTVYSLHEDLYRLRPMKGDLHSHSYRSDGTRDPAALAGHYREQGYDFLALTDHNRYYPGDEMDDAYRGVRLGLTRVLGEEIHTPDSPVHLIHIGGKSSVADLYVHHREDYDRAIVEYEQRVPDGIPEAYRGRYARVMWASDRVHEAGGLLIFPHPFWRPGKSRLHNVRDELARILLTSGLCDAYELIGGMGQLGNNRSVAMWGELRAEGLKLPVVGSSDSHHLSGTGVFGNLYTICFAEDSSNDAITNAVRNGLCVAVEATGIENTREYRCYGSVRLTDYAQFLLRHYFSHQQRVCQGEGVAMRAYLMGEADAKLIELQAEQTERFRSRFFGREQPVLPSYSVREYEAKWRAVQLDGPLTCGGTLKAPPTTRRI